MKVVAIIPARYASTRFPGKPLAQILGRPMIQWVWERTVRASLVSRTLVATDDSRIAEVVNGFGGEVVMTRPDHPSGTDRLAEVAQKVESDLFVNVQGDEPLIDPQIIDAAVQPLLANPEYEMGTLKSPISDQADYRNPNVVKVVTGLEGQALYFSRASIPFRRDGKVDEETIGRLPVFRHIGLYVYRKEALLAYPTLPVSPLEGLEQLEQLRALENGWSIMTVTVDSESHGVDTPEDLQRIEELVRRHGRGM
ncbi:MAG: 3-deoxy-manno-octulosonate cytidylyltransferase [Desulfuromonas sp.]|nr:MAG: 3-deoxy-manno-octulosonate cytidylyltransferase [Desulfuromonas sp.]